MSLKRLMLFVASLFVINLSHAVTLHEADGKSISTSSLKGKWVIVNYWATWCDICHSEMPELNNFYKNNKDKNVLIFGVNYDHLKGKELNQAMHEIGISFPVLQDDPDQVWGFGYSDVLPVTYVVNPQGKIAKKFIGPTDEQSLLAVIKSSEKK